MKTLLSIAALSCALPLHAVAQDAAPAEPPCRADDQAAERASAALPARAGTRPMPERGTVAPASRVPSHVESASSRAMAASTARREAEEAKKSVTKCGPAAQGVVPRDEEGKR